MLKFRHSRTFLQILNFSSLQINFLEFPRHLRIFSGSLADLWQPCTNWVRYAVIIQTSECTVCQSLWGDNNKIFILLLSENSFEWILVGNWLLPLFIYFATIDWLKYQPIKLLFHAVPPCLFAWHRLDNNILYCYFV